MRMVSGLAAAGLCALAAVAGQSVAFASGGGGGGGGDVGGGGFSNTPTQSTPQYDAAAEYQKGAAALAAKNFKDAARYFDHVLQVTPRDANSNYLMGLSQAGLGNNKRAAAAFERATKYDPDLLEAQTQLAVARAKLGEADKAKAIRDKLAQKRAACGASCASAAQYDSALKAIDDALAAGAQARLNVVPGAEFARPARADQAYSAATSLINQHRYQAAIAALHSAMKAVGPHPDVLTYLGFANRKLGQYDAAEGYYRAALAIAPRHRGALEYYGELKVERGDLAGARANLALLDKACAFGCQQAEELRRWIAVGGAPNS